MSLDRIARSPAEGLSRRRFLAAGVAMGALAASGLGPAFAQSAVDWKKHAGTTLEVNLIKSPRGDILRKYQSEFEELTGIKVNSEATPEQQQRQKAVIELTSGRPSFDVVHLSFHVQKRQFEKGGWLADLSGFLKDPTLTEATLNEADFAQAGMQYAKDKEGTLRALPFSVDYWIVYWNKDLFAAKSLQYPETFDAMVTAAKALKDDEAGTSGFVARGMKNANTPVWTALMLGYGQKAVGDDGVLNTDGTEAVAAAAIYQDLMTNTAPRGATGFNWAECQSAFLQGKVGMWLDGIGFAAPLENPELSRVVGKVGYGVMPAGPATRAAPTFGDGLGVTEASQKKEAAYLYCQWAISKEMGARLFQAGAGVPFRNSIVNDPEVLAGVSMPKDWATAVSQSAKISQIALPVIVPVTEFRDVYGVALTNLLAGADAAAELSKATEQFKPILARSEAS
ncbi:MULTISPECIES: ABC transporter substrate-binding protein [unclassified Aureimonas]|uniref:ABC transporter substrate-binding protein n=1 Tax=unclassified Aureimonas TaxID=2615206 RepID=UPI0006FB0059|nr:MULTISPECIES: extracellular solute-binding protein [unclassified Aureimonas]KQT58268.1 ABC transporter substrate-binding protein [Aureimonas sp. Leaf427]KQT65086.1 ABC transporter substrate-binding protein [Aureimonas sp. Leaf460]